VVAEQVEPLWQSVALTDPEVPNEPSTYEQHLFFASDPEWQCEAAGLGAYGSLFKDRPEHCQRKALYAAGAYLPWEGEVTNVLKISKRLQVTRLPEILFGGASGHEIMRRTLSITNKFASGGPSSVGDGGWSQTGEHEWEVTAYEPFPSDIEQSLDPKNAGEPFTGGFSKHEKKVIEKALEKAEKLTQDAGCDEALKKYGIDSLNSLVQMYRPDGTNWESEILDGRDTKVNVQVGVDRETGGPIRETTINSPLIPAFVKEDGKTYINSTFFNYSRFGDIARALVFIHEAVHAYGKKHDLDFTKAGKNQETGSQAITRILVDECYPAAKAIVPELANL